MDCVGEAPVGSLSGLGMDADIVLEVYPGHEGRVELFEGLEAGALGFALEVVFDDLVDGFDLALAVGLIGFMVEFDRPQLGKYPGKLLGDVDRSIVQIHLLRDAPAEHEALEGILMSKAGEAWQPLVDSLFYL